MTTVVLSVIIHMLGGQQSILAVARASPPILAASLPALNPKVKQRHGIHSSELWALKHPDVTKRGSSEGRDPFMAVGVTSTVRVSRNRPHGDHDLRRPTT